MRRQTLFFLVRREQYLHHPISYHRRSGVDEPQRLRIRDDLRGFFQGELLFGDCSPQLYGTAASVFQVLPLGVAAPRAEDGLRVLVCYAADPGVALIARGGGTGAAGACLGPGLIVDFSRYIRAIEI